MLWVDAPLKLNIIEFTQADQQECITAQVGRRRIVPYSVDYFHGTETA